MVFLAQGPGPFVSRRVVCDCSRNNVNFVKHNKTPVLPNVYNKHQVHLTSGIASEDLPVRFDFSSSLFFNFSEEKLPSFEGPPAAEALLALSAWIQ